MKNVKITSHAKERAKQRLSKFFNNIDNKSLEFEFKIIEIFRKSDLASKDVINGKISCIYRTVINNKIIEFKTDETNNTSTIITIIVKD